MMIYFDNAATTRMKPPEVAEAVARAITSFGGVGRGVHEASLDAGMTVFSARQKLSDLFGGPGAKRVAFAYNATEAHRPVRTVASGRSRHYDSCIAQFRIASALQG